ncbi:helix-hairpin-helix domain-containing protein [Metasolibacillus sp. FSL K6-0083]|uniref:helix-hairpin-helix domain-containing protein n=1 Tax=Metasolibacillus sp. FSL K6-0083 TaxID=2921416 RepID=UPI003159F7DA
MSNKSIKEVEKIILESLNELESPKGFVEIAVRKLLRAAKILNEKEIVDWCDIQLGNSEHIHELKKLLRAFREEKSNVEKIIQSLEEKGLNMDKHFPIEDLEIKINDSSGGYKGIGFIEERYNDLVRLKNGNDGTHYKNELSKHLKYVANKTYEFSTTLHSKVVLTEAPKTSFDVLKEAVDDKLLDINPELAEKLMVAFKRISSESNEEWSQALTTCRRFIEELADTLYPPSPKEINGRKLGVTQYINRLWAFMDENIASSTNKELAKAHVDILGAYLQKIHKQTNKGVHSALTRTEAVKSVFHTYLMVADILEYLELDLEKKRGLDIMTATLDELQSFLNISKNVAKEIVKYRAINNSLTIKDLKEIKGVGDKTIKTAIEVYGVL